MNVPLWHLSAVPTATSKVSGWVKNGHNVHGTETSLMTRNGRAASSNYESLAAGDLGRRSSESRATASISVRMFDYRHYRWPVR
jgi:hypothetical protein